MQISQAPHEIPVPPAEFSDARLVNQVWSRWEHGNVPVRVWKRDSGRRIYELGNFDGPARYFRSASQLVSTITGKNSGSQSFARYFGTGIEGEAGAAARARPDHPSDQPSILTFFSAEGSRIVADGHANLDGHTPKLLLRSRVVGDGFSKSLDSSSTGPNSRFEILNSPEAAKFEEILDGPRILHSEIQKEEAPASSPSPSLGSSDLVAELDAKLWSFHAPRDVEILEGLDKWLTPKGIDLTARGKYAPTLAQEVRKILHSKFWGLMVSQGYDPDEVLQEVYKGILTRNNGKCPWDRRKATFGYYVHMVIRGVLINYHRKQGRRMDRNPESLENLEFFGRNGQPPVETGAMHEGQAYDDLEGFLASRTNNRPEGLLACEILPYVSQGMTRREIVARTGHKETAVAKALSHLRRVSKEWAAEVGVTVR